MTVLMTIKKIDCIEMKIPAKSEYISLGRLTLSSIANQCGFSYEIIEDLKIAISEAITNAVTHAYQNSEEGIIEIVFSRYEDRLGIRVKDEGITPADGVKLSNNRKPYTADVTADTLEVGGLGLFLIQALMDDVVLKEENGVEIEMIKYFDKE